MTEEALDNLTTAIHLAVTGQRKYYLSPFTDTEELLNSIKTRIDLEQLRHDAQVSQYNLFEFRCGNPGIWSLDDYRTQGVPKRHVFMLAKVYKAINLTPEERSQMASLTILED